MEDLAVHIVEGMLEELNLPETTEKDIETLATRVLQEIYEHVETAICRRV